MTQFISPETIGTLCETKVTPHQLYVYTVKGCPELVKVGIAKDSKKRKEFYYDELAFCVELPKRDIVLLEWLFHNFTYGLYSSEAPRMNVGHHQPSTANAKLPSKPCKGI